ncbi:MAG TPA: ATP-binding protein [Polyangia bacterium]|jgi:signal transduction histidine kinase/HAMP domain-containing protein
MSLRIDGAPKPRRRFRTRVFVSLLALALVTAAVAGAIFYRLQLEFIEKDRARRAATLLTSLATQAELGAYAGDAALCDLPARRTLREDDVVLAGVYDPRGKEILLLPAPGLGAVPPPPLARLGSLLADPDAPPVRLPAEGYDDLWAPIVTSARPAAIAMSSEPGGAQQRREVVGLARVGLSLVPAREQLAEVLRTGMYLAAFLAVLGALAALLIARRISDPILALAAGADAIRSGNLDVEIAVGSQDEVGLLAASFNAMAAELRETLGKLESLNRNLEAEVLRRTDEIRRSAEFTAVLNAAHEGEELKRLLEDALATLMAATEVRAAAILLTNEEALEFELHFAVNKGDDAAAFGPMPPHTALATGEPIVEPTRAIVPVLFRGQPEGAIVLVEPTREAIDFAARAAGQLAIAVSNARAYTALQHLARELTERNAALVKQRDQLQEMNRLKSEFLANVSHELRTPLNAILGYTELIHEGIYGPTTGEQREALDGVEESSRNLLTLINQILDLSKVESGKVEIYVTEVAMHDIAQHVAAEAQVFLRDKPLKINVVANTRIVVKTDSAKVQQIVTNLVSNAVKFTDHGSVTIEVAPARDGGCTISVKDTGIGIDKKDLQLIFEEFRQVDGSSTRKYAGTGLGLAIARRFAHLLGGTITVESTVGVGSTFTLTLPPEPRPRPPAPPPASRITGTMRTVPPAPSSGPGATKR